VSHERRGGVALTGSRCPTTYRRRVRRANRREGDAGEIPVSPDASVQPATPLLAPAPAVRGVADTARDAWRSELAELGGTSPLLHFVDAPTTRIELSTTHPGGLARFITGKSTLLSQLIRD